MPNVRDHDASVYLRLQGDALSVGGYEHNPIFWDDVSLECDSESLTVSFSVDSLWDSETQSIDCLCEGHHAPVCLVRHEIKHFT